MVRIFNYFPILRSSDLTDSKNQDRFFLVRTVSEIRGHPAVEISLRNQIWTTKSRPTVSVWDEFSIRDPFLCKPITPTPRITTASFKTVPFLRYLASRPW